MTKEIRTVDAERGIMQITTFDERWYARPVQDPETGIPRYDFVPSVTWVAGHYPKGIGFYKWLASHGWDEAEEIKHAAGDKGSKVHFAINSLVEGNKLAMDAKFLNPSTGMQEALSVAEWEALMSFVDWFGRNKPEVIRSEYVIWNKEHGYAGTVDLKCRMEGAIWAVDYKTSAAIWPAYELQLSAYKHADPEIERTAILQVGYRLNKKQKFKFTEIADKFGLFLAAREIWKNETAGQAPSQREYPLTLAL